MTRRKVLALVVLLAGLGVRPDPAVGQTRPIQPAVPAAPAPAFFVTPLSPDELKGKQAVVETTMGRMVIELLPDRAPNHVGYFIKLAKEGAYNGTAFHRVIKGGIIQGGDPLSKDPAKRAQYGTGGLGVLQAEPGAGSHLRGAVSAVLVPGKRDSAGSQFFICVTPQPGLDGQYTMFGRVIEGIGVVSRISEAPVDEAGRVAERVEITAVTIRDTPPVGPEPFSTESPSDLAAYRAVIETSLGNITIAFFPDKAPTHVRNFLRLAAGGCYDTTAFDRIVPGFMIQEGFMGSRTRPLDEAQQALVRNLQPEFNDTAHDKGIVSMARGDDPASASTSFFIVTARTSSLDGKYTAFGRVVAGMDVVEAIEKTPREGEAPTTRVDIKTIRVEKQ